MFAASYAPYTVAQQRDYAPYTSTYQHDTVSARARYVSAISRAREAEMEYAAYLVQQEREREQQRERERQRQHANLLRQQREEQARARAAAVKRLEALLWHAAVSSLLNAQSGRAQLQVPPREVTKPTPVPANVPQLRRNRVRPVRAPDAPSAEPVSAVRSALQRRLASEPSVEVHATIRQILSHLAPTSTPQPPVATAGPSQPPAVPNSLARVQRLERAFRALAADFVFPPQLDFPSPATSATADALPYTPRNAPVRQYEHALNGLLAQLDAVDSEGDAGVRTQRKRVVGMVEAALGEVDRIVEGRWKLFDVRARPSAAVPAATGFNADQASSSAPSPAGPSTLANDASVSTTNADQQSSDATASTAVSDSTPEPQPPTTEQPSQAETTSTPTKDATTDGDASASTTNGDQPRSEVTTASESDGTPEPELPEPSQTAAPSLEATEEQQPTAPEESNEQPVAPEEDPESLQLPATVLANEGPEPASVPPVTAHLESELPAVSAVETPAPSDEANVAAPAVLVSPKSLSLVTAFPDEEPVIVDSEPILVYSVSEPRDDTDSESVSTSSWSEIED
ncbi:hypothetical protein FB451DRAFT_1397145 [Mycena latifolia]|nr:hypothetical protein FB451DRAFT_1397145 [Mycena latifolia]